jgi:hypothetical protein
LHLRFFWRGLRPFVQAENRLGRLRKVLDQAGIAYPKSSPETALSLLPAAMPPAPKARDLQKTARMQYLHFPLPCPARVALVDAGFRAGRNMRAFAGEDAASIRAYDPEALVAPLNAALAMADGKRRGLFELPSLRIAIVLLTPVSDAPLSDDHRELLWRAFGVPLFEQLQGWNGSVIARECEVHDGLHIDESAAILQLHEDELLATQLEGSGGPVIRARTGLTAEIVTGPCECGAETPRLRGLAAAGTKPASAAA